MTNFNYTDYFKNLRTQEQKNAPRELFAEGDHSLLIEGVKVAVVGSRKASAEGKKHVEKLTKLLVELNIIVVSGLAQGIDTVAHETTITSGGKTIAVLGTPLSVTYPKKNKDILDQIKQNHLAVSQFPEGYPTTPKNFPMRNKTMALISDATIIIEASENSGTKHQGWEALRLGRSLFILDKVALNTSLTWPKKMIDYGAQVLSLDDLKELEEILMDIPNYTYKKQIDLAT